MANLRRLGVYGDNLPTRKARTVEPSNFLIGGIIGKFERKYTKAFQVNNVSDFQKIFGVQTFDPSTYGWDAVQGFFQNVVGVNAQLYVKSHVGYTGSAIDGVSANATVQNSAPENCIKLESAYLDNLDYSISGNRTGYTITNGARFTTALSGSMTATDTSAVLDSVIGIKVGDYVKFDVATDFYRKVLTVDQNTNTITWSGASGSLGAQGDAVTVLGFQIKTYRKSLNGSVQEVDTELGKIWCTIASEVTDFFVDNVFQNSSWLKVTTQTLATTPDKIMPATVSTVTYLSSGADGTAPTTSAHWLADLTAFDNLPVRMIANPETTDSTIQKAIETYCKLRSDNPKVIFNIVSDRTKAQLITIGQSFQRSDDVLGVIVADWLKVTDPYATSQIAPDRVIPNVGHVMGVWIRTIGLKGVHYIPQKDTPIFGINGIQNESLGNVGDVDRTDLANAGINIIQNIIGSGIVIRNLFTPSVSLEFQFANAILMREYIKVSVVDSLQVSENQPNSFQKILADKMAIISFMYNLWFRGSTGNVPEGETFAQSENEDGTQDTFDDHVIIQADAINNPQSSISAGNRNYDIWMTVPSPAGSIKIGAGLILLS